MSDHAPVFLDWIFGPAAKEKKAWILNTFLLESHGVRERIAKDILDFYTWNRGTASANIVWDAFKAYIRGILISIKVYLGKQKDKARVELVKRIQQLEDALKERFDLTKSCGLQTLYENLKTLVVQKISWGTLICKTENL